MHHRPDHQEPACASCKHQRKRCKEDCPMAPFFPGEKKEDFAAVHKLFGVSNVAKQLRGHENQEHRIRIAKSLIWVAKCFEEDPIDGPLGLFQRLENELHLYKSREYFATTTSQGTRLLYNPPPAPLPISATLSPPPPPPGVSMNGRNHNNVNGGINPYRNGSINLIDNIKGASPFSSLGDHHQNGSMRADHNSSSFQFHNFGVSNNGVVPELYHPPNISGGVMNNVVHQRQQQPSTNNNQLVQTMENQMLPKWDTQNGVFVPPHHHYHPKQSFNQQSYNSSGADANNSQNLG